MNNFAITVTTICYVGGPALFERWSFGSESITVGKVICDILVGRQDVTQQVTLPCLKVYVDRTKTATQVGGDAHIVVVGKEDADEGIVVVGDRIRDDAPYHGSTPAENRKPSGKISFHNKTKISEKSFLWR